jgi:hypothetical protein
MELKSLSFALCVSRDGATRTTLAHFFAENVAAPAIGLERSVTEGAASVNAAAAALAE